MDSNTTSAPAAPQIQRHSASLVGRRHEHGDIWSFMFRPETGFNFRAGQYVHFKLEDPELEKSVHHMSLASAPEDPELLFTMHMRAESPWKQSLLRLAPGGTVTLFKVKGEFVLPEDDLRPVVLLAAGVGVTPFRSMLRHLHKSGRSLPLSLVHVDRGPWLFEHDLSELAGEQRRIGREALSAALDELRLSRPDALYYIAGPTPFVFAQRDALTAAGIAESSIRIDDFESYEELWPEEGTGDWGLGTGR